MYSDNNQDGSARVRHVPIHIESRNEDDMQSPNQRQTRGPNVSQDRYTNTYRDYSQTSPDTSSIDIKYRPSPPIRNQQQHSSDISANRQQHQQPQYDSSRSNHHHHNHQQPQHYQHQPQHQQQQEERLLNDRERPNSSASISPNSEKLVNSPEPIPLPPPPNSNGQNVRTSNVESDTSYQPKPCEAEKAEGSEQQPQRQQQQQPVQRSKDASVMGMINSVKIDVMNIVKDITKFDGISAECKEYRYLDEMLTRCMLSLDDIQCGDASELRQQRKAAIKLVDQATEILQRKLQINTDIHNLSESMAISSSSSMNI